MKRRSLIGGILAFVAMRGLARNPHGSARVAGAGPFNGVAAITESPDIVSASGTASGGATGWQALPIGGGGFVRNLNMAADGTMVCTTDTTGAYLFDYTSQSWVQLVTGTSMPSAYVAANYAWNFSGVYSAGIAPSNTQILFMNYNNNMWKSTNKGNTWTQLTGWGTKNCPANDTSNFANMGQKIAVDPNNPNIVYAGAATAGLFVSTDGGTTWNAVSGVPAGTGAGITGVVFGLASNVIGGVTQVIYACRAGTGVYVTTNGGSTWTLTTGGPTTVQNAVLDNSGNYWCAGNSNNVWKYTASSGTWANLVSGSGNGMWSVAVNPFNNSQIVGIDESGHCTFSSNGGSTWSGINFNTDLVTTLIPWLGPTSTSGGSGSNFFIDTGNVIFSPLTNGLMFIACGIGIFSMSVPSNPTSATALTWDGDVTAGIENLVTQDLCVPPGTGQVVISVGDRSTFWITPNTYPSKYLPVTDDQITPAWGCDFASSDSTYVCACGNGTGSGGGFSHNNGSTWSNFSSQPTGMNQQSGSIACSTPSNIIYSPNGSIGPQYTTDGGATWHAVTISGLTFSNFNTTGYSDGTWRKICADRVTANVFYMYTSNTTVVGLYKTTDGGVTWTKQFSGNISGNSGWEDVQCPQLKAAPNNAGHLFYTPGPIGQFTGATITAPTAVPFSRSTDGGVTWTAVANVRLVSTFGFGAPNPSGGTYPAVFINGFVNQGSGYVFGYWQSDDDCATWTYLGQFAGPQGLGTPIAMSGDMSNYGYCYVGLAGFGGAASAAQYIP